MNTWAATSIQDSRHIDTIYAIMDYMAWETDRYIVHNLLKAESCQLKVNFVGYFFSSPPPSPCPQYPSASEGY